MRCAYTVKLFSGCSDLWMEKLASRSGCGFCTRLEIGGLFDAFKTFRWAKLPHCETKLDVIASRFNRATRRKLKLKNTYLRLIRQQLLLGKIAYPGRYITANAQALNYTLTSRIQLRCRSKWWKQPAWKRWSHWRSIRGQAYYSRGGPCLFFDW